MDIEKVVDAHHEAILDIAKQVEEVRESVSGIQLKEGPAGPEGRPGKSPNAESVAAMLIAKHADILRAPEVDVAELAAHLVAKHADALRGEPGMPGIPGLDGKDAEPVSALDVAIIIKEKFADVLRGKEGPRGEAGPAGNDADPVVVAGILATKHADELRGPTGAQGEQGVPGAAGKDADPEAIAEVLASKHADKLRGEQGATGPQGPAGKDADVVEFAKHFADTYADLVRGKDGRDGVDGKSVELNDVITELVAKHADVLRGQAGKDGITSIVTDTTVKAWAPEALHLEGSIVTHFLGRKYMAVRDTTEEPGESSDWQRVGTEGMRLRGDHKGIEEGDLFIKDFSLWGFMGGAEKLLVGRPRVDHAKLAREVVELGEVGAHLEHAVTKHLGSDRMRHEAERAAKQVVQVHSEGDEKFIIVDGEAHDITPTPEIVKEFVYGLSDTSADAPRQVRRFLGQFKPGMSAQNGDLILVGTDLWQALEDLPRVDSISNGRFIQVTSAPMTAGGGGSTGGLSQSDAQSVTEALVNADGLVGYKSNPLTGGIEISTGNNIGEIAPGRTAGMGDSITANGQTSYFNQLCLRSEGWFLRAYNAGIGGNTTTQMLARIATDIPANSGVKNVFIQGGTNDVAQGIPENTTLQNLAAMCAYVESFGARPILNCIPPKNSETDAVVSLRSKIPALAKQIGVMCFDPWAPFCKADGTWIDGASSDGVHPTMDTADAAAIGYMKLLAPHKKRGGFVGVCRSPSQKGAIAGSAGFMADTAADGIPDGWGGYGGLACTFSTAANSAPKIGRAWKITTAGGTADMQVQQSTVSGISLAANERFAVSAVVSVSGEPSGLKAHIRAQLAAGGTAAIAIEPTNFHGNLSECVVWGEGVAPAGGATSVTLDVWVQTLNATAAGYVEVSQMQVWRVSDLS